MKKNLIIFVMLFGVLISISSCKNASVYDVKIAGVSYEVNSIDKTINDGKYTYQYSFSGNKAYYTIRITYPDNFEYTYTHSGQTGTDSWNGNFNYVYTKPETLCNVILADVPKPINAEIFFAKVISFLTFIGIGIFFILFPDVIWKLKWGWRYKNSEPSEAAIKTNQFIGVIAIIASIIILFI